MVDDNEKWLITPFETLLQNKLFFAQFLFAISLLDLKEEKPFQNAYEVLAVDKQVIVNLLTRNFFEDNSYPKSFLIEDKWNDMKLIFEGYNALDSIPFGVYPIII